MLLALSTLLDLPRAMSGPHWTDTGVWGPQGSAFRTSIIILGLDVVIPNSGSELCSIVLVPVPCSVGQLTSNQPIAVGSLNHGDLEKLDTEASSMLLLPSGCKQDTS